MLQVRAMLQACSRQLLQNSSFYETTTMANNTMRKNTLPPCTLVLRVVALLVTGAATVGTDLAQPPVSGPRAVACPLPWLPVIVASAPPAALRRRLSNVLTDKGALQTAVQEHDANSTDAIEKYGPIDSVPPLRRRLSTVFTGKGNASSHARRLAVTCPSGYYDSTNGNAHEWACGCNTCLGGCFTDSSADARRSESSAVPPQWMPVLSAASVHAAAVAEDGQTNQPALSLNSSSHARRLKLGADFTRVISLAAPPCRRGPSPSHLRPTNFLGKVHY